MYHLNSYSFFVTFSSYFFRVCLYTEHFHSVTREFFIPHQTLTQEVDNRIEVQSPKPDMIL